MAAPLRNRTLFLADAGLLLFGSIAAIALRFENLAALQLHFPLGTSFSGVVAYLVLTVPVRLGVFWKAGIYRRLWRYAGRDELLSLLGSAGLAAFANLLLGLIVVRVVGLSASRIPLSVLALDGAMTLGLPILLRVGIRTSDRRTRSRSGAESDTDKRVLIAGAGTSGRLIVTELRRGTSSNINPVGFLDDDLNKQGQTLAGLPILGRLADLEAVARTTGAVEVIIAMPSASGSAVRAITESAQLCGLATRTVPGLLDLASGRISIAALRKVEISDLLRRESATTDIAGVRFVAQRRRILVTGAGGSIGSELCRQLANQGPASIGLLGHGENSIFKIHAELKRRFPEVSTEAIICDVRDQERLRMVFEHFRPQVVFHAAAHKHVTLMEQNPEEAVTNNVAGTRNVATLAREFDASRFVLISSDKAVRPTSFMGASKRIAEQLVQEIAFRSDTHFTTVRLGNVLGSRGSVVPIFLDQIQSGGPVTVSHPEVRRYFMTIPEAVQLVLQAAAIGKGHEVFALDMGAPVKIVDLARDLILLSGLVPEKDIRIVFSGLKRGEKLYEEVFFDRHSTEPTVHPKVMRAKMIPNPSELLHSVDILTDMAQVGIDPLLLRRAMQRLVPEFQSPGDGQPAEPAIAMSVA